MIFLKNITAVTIALSVSNFANATTPAPVDNAFIASYISTPYYAQDNYRGDMRQTAELPLLGGDQSNVTGFSNVGDFEWQKTTGSTDTPGTGPTSSLLKDELSHWDYWYFETSPNFANKKRDTAIIEGTAFNTEQAYVTFDYHMFGRNTGHLSVEALVNGQWQTIWKKGGQQQNSSAAPWRSVSLPLDNLGVERSQIRFKAVANGDAKGDIAIDNIQVNSAIFDNRINITYADYISSYYGHLTWKFSPADGVEKAAPEEEDTPYNTPWKAVNDKLSYTQFVIGVNTAGEKKWIHSYESIFLNPYPTPYIHFFGGMDGVEVCDAFGEGIWSISVQIWDDQDASTASETPVLDTIDCTWY